MSMNNQWTTKKQAYIHAHVLQISHPLRMMHLGQYQLGLISRARVTREMGTGMYMHACQLCACTFLIWDKYMYIADIYIYTYNN